MPTWKKVIVSGSNAHLASVTASSTVSVGTNQVISTTPAGTYLTGSFTGSFRGDGSNLTGVTVTFPTTAKTDLASTDQFFINDGANKFITYNNLLTDLAGTNLTVEGTDSLTLASQISVTGVSASFTGSLTGALVGTASWATNAVTANAVANNLTQGAGITTFTYNGSSAQTVSLRNNGALSINTVLKWDSGNGQLTNSLITDDGTTVTVGGNLSVTGTTVTVNTENLTVSDKFILLASGSTTNVDAGIIASNAANNTGSAFYYDGTDQRWAVAPAVASSATLVTANSYIVTVSGSGADPSGNPLYGNSNATRIGAMYVNTTSEDIWIWS